MARGMGGIGPANIMKHLKGIHFPASKDDIVLLVKKGQGPDTGEVMKIVSEMSDKKYGSVTEIMKEVGKIE